VVQCKGQIHAYPLHAGRHFQRCTRLGQGVSKRVMQLLLKEVHVIIRGIFDVYVNVMQNHCRDSASFVLSRAFAKQRPHPMATTYTISDLAKEFDLTTRAMRFYEDMGLLQPQREGAGGRNRVYTARDRTRLKLTLRAKRLGLSLVEAKEIIDSYDSPRDTAPQLKKFLTILTEHRKKLEAQMVDLQANLDEIRTHEKEAKALLVKTEKTKSAKS
jgi:DNA-binding transcriptional MerR regulator